MSANREVWKKQECCVDSKYIERGQGTDDNESIDEINCNRLRYVRTDEFKWNNVYKRI